MLSLVAAGPSGSTSVTPDQQLAQAAAGLVNLPLARAIDQQEAKAVAAGPLNLLSARTAVRSVPIGWQQAKAPPEQEVAAPWDPLLAKAVVRSVLIGQQQEQTV